MAPPAKRRKRNVLPSSSPSVEEGSEEELVQKPKLPFMDLISSSPPPVKGTKRRASVKPVSKPRPVPSMPRMESSINPTKPTLRKAPTKSPSTSPDKPKGKGKFEDKVKSGNIYTFFTKQAQKQQADGARTTNSQVPPQSSISLTIEDDDLISDDEFSTQPRPSSMVGQTARKRAKGIDAFKNDDGNIPSMSQKFMAKPKAKEARDHKIEEDMRPWAERFGPVNLDELAVHKKKVSDVKAWLEDVMNGRRRQRLLVLKGAAGTGKTTTVQLLAKAMDCDILEWRNPVASVATSDGYQSMAAQFEEFMGRGGKFGQLDIISDNANYPSKPDIKPLDRRKQIILVEEFPNTFTRSSTALQSFRSALVQYLASNTPPLSMMYNNKNSDPITPVVMIISETLLTTTSASADSFTAHRLLDLKFSNILDCSLLSLTQ